MRKGKPFLELFSTNLSEDCRFPILELFIFLYTLGAFSFVSLTVIGGRPLHSEGTVMFSLINAMTGMPLFLFVILILKNIAYGLGNDLEKGVIQTFLSYPLKRRLLLTSRLLSSLGVVIILFLGTQIFALFLLTPEIIFSHMNIVLITYAAILAYPLLIAGLTLLITISLRRGSLALITGIMFYFAIEIFVDLVSFNVRATGSALLSQVLAVLNPTIVLKYHYEYDIPKVYNQAGALIKVWTPNSTEALLYIGASYFLVFFVFFVSFYIFERRMEV